MARRLVAHLLLVTGALIIALAAHAKPIEIDYWGVWGGQAYEIEQSIIAEFNRQYEGRIKVTGVEVPEGPDARLPVAVAGGSPPAVIKINRPFMGEYAAQGLLQSLDDLIARHSSPLTITTPQLAGRQSSRVRPMQFLGIRMIGPCTTTSDSLKRLALT